LSYDNACKYLAEKYPQAFVRWLLGTAPPTVRVLKAELNVEPIHADSILFLKIGQQILHIEFQTLPKSTTPLPLRMLDYKVRLKRQYGCQVIQVVIFLKKTTSPLAFQNEYRDETTIHKYRVIRLWEEDSTPFLENQALLPLAPLTKSDVPEDLVAEVAQKVNEIEDEEEKRSISSCTSILAGLRFKEDLVRSLFREEIMKESVIYQSILKEGIQQGMQQGMQQGLQQGLQQGMQEGLQRGMQRGVKQLVMMLLNSSFGTLESRLMTKIDSLSVQQLKDLAAALLNFTSVEDLDAWLGYPQQ